jgi:hypothetical protein
MRGAGPSERKGVKEAGRLLVLSKLGSFPLQIQLAVSSSSAPILRPLLLSTCGRVRIRPQRANGSPWSGDILRMACRHRCTAEVHAVRPEHGRFTSWQKVGLTLQHRWQVVPQELAGSAAPVIHSSRACETSDLVDLVECCQSFHRHILALQCPLKLLQGSLDIA